MKEVVSVIESVKDVTGQSVGSGTGILGSFLTGNFRKNYDITGNLKTDVAALQEILKSLSQGVKIDDALKGLNGKFTISKDLEDFAKTIDTSGKSLNQLSAQYIPEFIANTTGATSAANFFGTTLKSIGSVAMSVGAQLAVSFAIGALFNGLIFLAQEFGETIDDVLHPAKALDEEIEKQSQVVDGYASEVEQLQSELDSTNEKIKELSNADAGEFVDQQELDKLRVATIELENQLKLKQMLRAEEATELNNDVADRAAIKDNVTYYEGDLPNFERAVANNSGVPVSTLNSFEMWAPTSDKMTAVEALNAYMDSYDNLKENLANLEKAYSEKLVTNDAYIFAKNGLSVRMEEMEQSAADAAAQIQNLYDSLDPNGENFEEIGKSFSDIISKYVEFDEKSVQGLTDLQRAYKNFSAAVSGGDEDAKKLQEALSGGNIDKSSDAYKYAEQLADRYNVSVEDLIFSLRKASEASGELGVASSAMTTNASDGVKNLSTAVGLLNEALATQSTSAGVAQDAYDALIEADSDYAAALEYSNGHMQLNQEVAEKITKAKVEEAKANIELAYSQNQLEYAQNKADIATLDRELENNNNLTEEQRANLEAARDALEAQNSAIRDNCESLQMQYSALSQVSSAYAAWQNAKNTTDQDAMLLDLNNALADIEEGLTTQRIGTDDFKTAVNLLVPDEIPETEIADYQRRVLDRFLQFDDEGNIKAEGLNNFIKKMLETGMLEANDDGSLSWALDTTLSDIANASNVTEDVAQALLGGLEAYGWDIDWESMLGDEVDNLRMKIDDLNEKMEGLDPNSDAWKELNDELADTQEQLSEIYASQTGGLDAIAQGIQDAVSAGSELTDDQASMLNGGGRVQVSLDLAEAKQDLAELQAELGEKSELTLVDMQSLMDAQGKVEQLTQEKERLGEPTSIEIEAYLKSDTEAETKKKIQQLSDAGVIDLDSSKAMTDLESAARQIQGIKDDAGNVVLSIDTTTAQSNIQSVKDAIDSIPNSKVITVKINQKGTVFGFGVGNLSSGVSSKGSSRAGGGLSSGGRTLVGELGPEMVVDPENSEWYTVGESGAEFVDLPKDAIVFDHEKTRKLLNSGSAGGRGTAFAYGKAYNYGVSGSGHFIGEDPVVQSSYKGYTSATKSNTAAVDANRRALEAQKEALEKQKEAYEKESNALKIYGQAAINEIDKRIDAINKEREAQDKAYQDQIKNLQKYQKEQDKAYEKQIEALEDKKKALQKANDEEDRAIELAELQDELARAQSQRTVRIYNENEGFVWAADQEAVDEAQDNLDDQQREWNNEDEIQAIDDEIDRINDLRDALDESIEAQIEAIEERQEAMNESFDAETEKLEELRDQWSEAMGLIGMSWDDYQLSLAAAAEFSGMSFEQMAAGVGAYKDDVVANMQAIGETAAQIDKVTEAINALESVTGGGGGESGGSGSGSGGEGGGSEEGSMGSGGNIGSDGGSGLSAFAQRLMEAGGVSEETALKLDELRNKIIELGEENEVLAEKSNMLTLAGDDLSSSLLLTGDAAMTTQEAWMQLSLAQSQMAENQGMMAELSAQYVETLGNETTATEEARQIGVDGLTALTDQYGVSYDAIFAKLSEYVNQLITTGTASSEQLTFIATTVQMFSTSAVASLSATSSEAANTAASFASMASSIVNSCNQAIAALQRLKAEQKSASMAKHATGILNSPTTHMAHTDEVGPEIKIRPMSGQYSLIERGDTVIPHGPSENLWKFGMNPDAYISRHMKQMASPRIEITQPQEGGVTVGDVTIQMYGVNDVQSFGEVLEQKAASIVAQTFARRK